MVASGSLHGLAQAQDGSGRRLTLDGRSAMAWSPAAAGAAPLVVFSHGLGGCAQQSRFLMTALAEAGYLVVSVNHADASCGLRPRSRPQQPLREPMAWSDATYRDRRDDVAAVLAALRTDAAWAGRIDWQRVAVVGHSLGGYTALGIAGAWPSWRLPEVKAVVAMSPYCLPYQQQRTLGGIGIPVMYQGGTKDYGVTPGVRKDDGCWQQTPSPATYVEFEGAAHFAWSERGGEHHALINAHTIAWLDAQLHRRVPPVEPPVEGVSAQRRK